MIGPGLEQLDLATSNPSHTAHPAGCSWPTIGARGFTEQIRQTEYLVLSLVARHVKALFPLRLLGWSEHGADDEDDGQADQDDIRDNSWRLGSSASPVGVGRVLYSTLEITPMP